MAYLDFWTPIDGASGSSNVVVTDVAAVGITPPLNANGCIINVQADPAQVNLDRVISFLDTGIDPTAAVGLFLADGDFLMLTNISQIEQFRAIGIEAGLTQHLQIQWYKNVI